ncbi:MAG TPA: prenyltransferase/squalene oxidase repeat-containing protein [Solirubrobacterales bacterium]|nr:prenyltransferase/squalene oxidase repeat-containing protein [Solirubrobacterales bacterium]
MSWQLVSFLILGAGLLAGFAWYELRRPPSQVVALVAALAALAIAGRVAFAAFPNVKPTTDIVIFAGYALGGAPGFVVGALTALVSNFWFGQGPWTPWQMAGWGLCGLIGAALGIGWRNVGRFGLAAVCGGAALVYGALLNFSLMATYGYGELSWERFAILEGRAVPFEVAHVVGNVVFALIAGPAMLRMLVRFRERFEWSRGGDSPRAGGGDRGDAIGPGGLRPRWRGGVAALLLVLLALAPLVAPPSARATAGNVGRAAEWLISTQNEDGGFGPSPGERSGDETTCWAMVGLEAVGINPLDIRSAGKSPVDFLRRGVADLQHPGDIARTIIALEGAGIDPRDFGGHNLVARLLSKRRKDGSYEGWPGTTAFAAIALRAAGVSGGLDKTLAWLRAAQNEDGGWGDLPDAPSTADDTGAAMQALAAGSKAANRGLSYLSKVQRKGGGFPLGGNGEVNSQSTAWAVQGIIHAGANPDSFRKGGNAAEYLAARQATDGHYRYSKSSDQTPVWVTGEVLVAAMGKYYPVPPAPRLTQPKPAQQNAPSTQPTSPPSQESSPPQSGSATSGGVAPSTGVPPSGSGSSPASPGGSASGAGGTPSGHSAPPAEIPPGESSGSTGGASGGGATSPALEATSVSGQEGSQSDSGTTTFGAILTALLAAVLLVGAAWVARRVWMRQRYGL